METVSLKKNIINATKWSLVTQVAGKIVVPITNMILARILVPEAFGVIASVNMIISFADMFTDAGFQKYIVQHEFENDDEKKEYINVAFWTNLMVSILLWILISVFSNQLATMVGNDGLGHIFIISGIALPLTSFSSIQMAIFRREFDYRTLFYTRIVGIMIPFFITIPLAMLGLSYWSLIIASIIGNMINAIILTVKSTWKPRFYYKFKILKSMLEFSIWTLAESIATWLISWSGTFIVGNNLSQYYIGIYKTSISTVNGITGIVTDSTSSVLFSSLSRVSENKLEFRKIFLKFQRIGGYILFPLGVGIFLYRELITNILLGSQWSEASLFIGIWGLSSSISIIFGQYCNEVYRALGKPKVALLAQILHLVVLIPGLALASKYSFKILIYFRCLVRIQYVIIHIVLMNYIVDINFKVMFNNIYNSLIGTFGMIIIYILLNQISNNILWKMVSIIICIFVYFGLILMLPKSRREILGIAKQLFKAS